MVTLPKQVLPLRSSSPEPRWSTGSAPGNILLARDWAVPLEQILQTIEIATVYGTEKISSAYAAIGDLIEDVA